MQWPRRFQFGLRTLLIALWLLPPFIAAQYRRVDMDRLWDTAAAARQRRERALVDWGDAYDAIGTTATLNIAEVEDAERRYYAARQDLESAYKALFTSYGNSEKRFADAIDARHKAVNR